MTHVKTITRDHVLEIRISRPEKLNALSPEMYGDIATALGLLDRSPELRVGLICADGKHFSSGIELDRWAPIFAEAKGFPVPEGGLDPFALTGKRCSKPLVIAVQGYCFTWGVELLLTTDIRVAATNSSFAMLEVKRGLYPCGGATLRLPQQMGWANAQRHLLTGKAWTADDAFRTGLIQQVVDVGSEYDAALAIAGEIAAAAPLGVQAVLRSSRLAHTEGESTAASHLMDDMPNVMHSADAKEGVASFLERRAAHFQGR